MILERTTNDRRCGSIYILSAHCVMTLESSSFFATCKLQLIWGTVSMIEGHGLVVRLYQLVNSGIGCVSFLSFFSRATLLKCAERTMSTNV